MVQSNRYADPRRWVLASAMSLIGAVLTAGGIYLTSIGGSLYYVIAGLVVVGCAYFIARGDARGRWLYAIFLVGTLAWALWERGLNVWALQARLFVPAVLGIWVFWPALREWPRALAGTALLVAAAIVWLFTGGADPDMKPSASAGVFESGRGDWPHFGNDLAGTRYSPAAQIAPDNVGQLKEAWSIRTGTKSLGIGFEATPLFVKDTLYVCTPASTVIALDPDTGERRWTFDPKAVVPLGALCRGVAYYAVPNGSGHCAERIIFHTVDARLMAVDARDGMLCSDFGEGGSVDLKRGLGSFVPGYWRPSSAPEIVRGNVILGAFVMDGQYVGEPSGVVRGYDAVTGRLAWAWDMDHPERRGEPPEGQTYSPGTANSWGPLSGDEALGLVYLPTGNSTPDYWGAHRSPASEKYASSVVALDASTGELRWSFQTVHHDLWDYDVSAQPTLVDLPIDGRMVPALIQPTKQGQVFVLDRRTGTPLTTVEERPVPQGPASGDFLSPTQPFSSGMPSFDDTIWSERSMWGTTPIDQLWCRIKFREARYDGPFTPPGVKPTIQFPAFLGGINWGSVAVDPERRLMVVNWSRMANYNVLIPRAMADAMGVHVVREGSRQELGDPVAQAGTPFAVAARPFWSFLRIPCTEPPFGKITVVDLERHQSVWEHPLGSSRDSGPLGIPSHLPLPMGVPSAGGSLVTKSGLIFIAAAQEHTFRAFDIRDGRKLWSIRLPAGGQATPMTYVSPRSGRQYVLIAAGGNYAIMSKMGDYVVAYALPGTPSSDRKGSHSGPSDK
jgi:quinoprotein glucose dehydrogenase